MVGLQERGHSQGPHPVSVARCRERNGSLSGSHSKRLKDGDLKVRSKDDSVPPISGKGREESRQGMESGRQSSFPSPTLPSLPYRSSPFLFLTS